MPSYAVISADEVPILSLVGQAVALRFEIADEAGSAVSAATVALTVAIDGGPPATVATSNPAPGDYRADYVPATAGAYVARLVASGTHAGVAELRWHVTGSDPSTLTAAVLRDYLGASSATDGQILGALAAERVAQARRCRIVPYTPDLLEALMRRVARNLAARSVPVASFTSFEGVSSSTRVPATDAEIKRLEAPARRRTVG